jgi:hypothetical protein
MNCNDKARSTPSTLEIRNLVTSEAGRCMVRSGCPASHDIVIRNWGGIPYSVDVHGECQTPCVRYRETDGFPRKYWDPSTLLVQSYPGSGAPPERVVASKPLMSCCAARAQNIRADLCWDVPGWPCASGKESLVAQVDTL